MQKQQNHGIAIEDKQRVFVYKSDEKRRNHFGRNEVKKPVSDNNVTGMSSNVPSELFYE